jgi:predicted transcriptional regulator
MLTATPTRPVSMTPMSLRVDSNTRARLNTIAQHEKRSSHALALDALEYYVLKKEREMRWNQQAMASLEDYQTTGLHVTHEELDEWLATWGTDAEKPAPVCHT